MRRAHTPPAAEKHQEGLLTRRSLGLVVIRTLPTALTVCAVSVRPLVHLRAHELLISDRKYAW